MPIGSAATGGEVTVMALTGDRYVGTYRGHAVELIRNKWFKTLSLWIEGKRVAVELSIWAWPTTLPRRPGPRARQRRRWRAVCPPPHPVGHRHGRGRWGGVSPDEDLLGTPDPAPRPTVAANGDRGFTVPRAAAADVRVVRRPGGARDGRGGVATSRGEGHQTW